MSITNLLKSLFTVPLVLSLTLLNVSPSDAQYDRIAIPRIKIDGIFIPDGLVHAQLKMRALGIASIHGNADFTKVVKDHFDDVAKQMIGREILNREAKRHGVKVDNGEFSRYLEGSLQSMGGRDGAERFFATQDLTLDQYSRLTRHAYLANKYVTEILLAGEPTEKEIRTFYLENVAYFTGTQKRHYRFVRLLFPDTQPSAMELKNIKNASKKVTSPGDLRKIAEGYKVLFGKNIIVYETGSESRKSAEGTAGFIYDKLEGVKPGSAVYFKRESGENIFHFILFLEKIEPPEGPDYKEARDQVHKEYMKVRSSRLVEQEVQRLKAGANIVFTTGS